MKHLLLTSLFFIGFIGVAQENSAELIKKVDGFSHPESVVLDENREVIYISNIGEDVPGDGFISKVDPRGEVLELKWIDGLNDPKGLQILDGKLYVSDNTELVEMDIESAEIITKFKVEDVGMFNDITVDEKDNLFISDSRKSAIYKKEKVSDEVEVWMEGENLQYPNGLLAVGDDIYIAAWGKEEGGNVLKINRNDKEISPVSKAGIGNLDGIQLNRNKNFYISDWATGEVHEIKENGEIQKILTSEKSSGDILFLPDENQLVLPMNHQNAVWWYQLN